MISDERLCLALEEYDQLLINSLPDPVAPLHTFSPSFQYKLKKLCRQMRHPTVYPIAKKCACAVLAVFIFCCILLSFNADVRATVVAWIKEQYEVFQNYFFTSEATSHAPTAFDVGWMPDGCEFIERTDSSEGGAVVYLNSDGQLIYLNYLFNTGASTLFVEDEHYTNESTFVNNLPADLYITESPDLSNGIVWLNSGKTTLFILSAPYDAPILIDIAESVFPLQ